MAIKEFIDFILHLDSGLRTLIAQHGMWTYAILFGIIFCETGFVITPFLPGDSLLFAAGALAASGSFHISWLFLLLAGAAILGDNVNYWIGHFIGERIFHENAKVLKRSYLDRTHQFYERHGFLAVIMARFVPIVRTISPFVAGVGTMRYRRFVILDVIGGILWVALFLFVGFFFGNLAFIKKNFELVILGIVLVSLLPPLLEYWRHRHSGSPSQK